MAKYWVGHNIYSDFSIRCYRKNPNKLFGQPNKKNNYLVIVYSFHLFIIYSYSSDLQTFEERHVFLTNMFILFWQREGSRENGIQRKDHLGQNNHICLCIPPSNRLTIQAIYSMLLEMKRTGTAMHICKFSIKKSTDGQIFIT